MKSLRDRKGSIQEAYVKPIKGELFLIGSTINEYDKGNRFNHDPERNRKLLMHRAEIIRLGQKIERKGLTLIPLKIYLKHGLVKVELGLCEGKHTYDKSAALKEKAVKKEAELSFEKSRRR